MGAVIDFNAARGVRVWQGIETCDPPFGLYDYADHLAMAERMLAAREKRFPAMVSAGKLEAEQAEAELATFRAIVADWRWICTGQGKPAPLATLALRCAALDASLRTIAEIARDEGGFSPELAAQADSVIAMLWHLEPGRRTHALARITHEIRADLRTQQEATHAV
ncbi:hypothetical protein OVA07_14135 [Novosphingobium sp. SL115]|uniref:hypothetical protein n=1 Tax=Novosphingobium sp. SL115 TaxID=2995150 RepID=UPI0022770575|nr:hypothetical protein [Novosphingobium sp. SL115]MCY1672143.1 hypothetical protein [Novosphingobium sp. SL115]